MSTKTALVIRATGAQGRAVTSHLLKNGWIVHALVTDPQNPRALSLQSMGAKLYKGSLSDPSAIETAIKGCSAIFLNQMPSFTDDSETREATKVLELAKEVGVNHVVHSTTLRLNDPSVRSNVCSSIVAPAILGKADVEDLVRASGIPWTIIRPGYFMTNLIAASVCYFQELAEGRFVNSFVPSTVLPLVDPHDIGAFVAAAFDSPDKFTGKAVSVASEKLNSAQIAREISRISGKDIEVVHRTDDEIEKLKDNPLMMGQVISRDLGPLVDMEEVKAWGIPLTSFREFLEKHRDAVIPKLVE